MPAVTSGSSAASSEPNTSSSTTSAASGAEPGVLEFDRFAAAGDLALDLRPEAIRRRRLGGVDELLRLARS